MAWADTLEMDDDGYYTDPNDGAVYSLESDGLYWNSDNSYAYDANGNEHSTTGGTNTSNNSNNFWGSIWGGVKTYATNQNVMNQALGALTGFNVSNNPNPEVKNGSVKTGGSTKGNTNGNTGDNPPAKSSNTVLYVVGGVVVLGMIVTMVVVIAKNKK